MKKSRERNSFHEWMASRIRMACKGVIFDHEAGHYVSVVDAKADVFLEHTRRRSEKMKQSFTPHTKQISASQARADSSDPFTAARVSTHLRGGLCELDDYHVEFRRQVTVVEFAGRSIEKVTFVPVNMKRA